MFTFPSQTEQSNYLLIPISWVYNLIFYLLQIQLYTKENKKLNKQNSLYISKDSICSIRVSVNIIQYFTLFQGPVKASLHFFLLNDFHRET